MTLEKLITRDLRIGNVVQDEHGSIMYVYRLWKDGAELASSMDGGDDLDYSADEIFGVPLIEELFTKIGFDSLGAGYFLGNFYFNAKRKTLSWFGVMLHDSLWNEVHKFQNLHYALTGIELDFTL